MSDNLSTIIQYQIFLINTISFIIGGCLIVFAILGIISYIFNIQEKREEFIKDAKEDDVHNMLYGSVIRLLEIPTFMELIPTRKDKKSDLRFSIICLLLIVLGLIGIIGNVYCDIFVILVVFLFAIKLFVILHFN